MRQAQDRMVFLTKRSAFVVSEVLSLELEQTAFFKKMLMIEIARTTVKMIFTANGIIFYLLSFHCFAMR